MFRSDRPMTRAVATIIKVTISCFLRGERHAQIEQLRTHPDPLTVSDVRSRSVATGTPWSGPMKSRRVHGFVPSHSAESDGGLGSIYATSDNSLTCEPVWPSGKALGW